MRPTPLARLVPSTIAAALALALTGALTAAGLPASAAAAPPLVKIKPQQLARGADPAIAHVEGGTVVDGTTRIVIDAARVDLLGRSGADYIVSAMDDQGVGPVLRVTPTGAQTVIVTPSKRGDITVLSTDGSRLAQAQPQKRFTSTKVTVWSSADGSVLTKRAFPGIVSVLDLDSKSVILGGPSDTLSWKQSSGLVRKLNSSTGYLADISANRLASFDKDPYDGGCSVVTTLRGSKVLWRSCRDRVEQFSPDGLRAATVDLLSDGIGPALVTVRDGRGKAAATYGIRGYFGLLTWEDNTNLLLESYGRKQSALVRCGGTSCARASEVAPTPPI